MMQARDIEGICSKLKPIIGKKADRLWYMYLAEDEKGRRDLALDIEIIAEKLLKKNPLQGESILLSPPSPYEASGEFLLGDVVYNNKKLYPLYLRPEDFIKQIGIFSVTGEGKTNLALLLALQLLKKKIPFLVIDWKRSWRNILSLQNRFPELKDLQVYTVGRDVVPFLWNPFRAPPGVHYKTWISVITEVLEKSHLGGLGVADFFIKIYERLFREFKFKNDNNNTDNKMYPNFFDGMRELSWMKVGGREFLWKQSALRIFRSFTFGPVSKAFNARYPVKLEQLLEKPVILELDQEMSKPLRIFFTEMILRFIHLYRLGQGETDKLKHVLFLEEIHNLFPKTRIERETFSSLENVYREIRAFGQGLVSITQHPSLLPIYILGNCHTQVILSLQHEDDTRAAKKSLFLQREQEAYLDSLKVGEAIVKIKGRVNPCHVKIPLVPIKKGEITDNTLRIRTGGYLPGLHDGKSLQKGGYLPGDKYNEQKEGKRVNNLMQELLIDIFKVPISSVTKRYQRLKVNPKYGNYYKKLLVSEGLVKPREITTRSYRIVLFELTPKGKALLRDLGLEVKDDREGIEHKFWKEKIEKYYRSKGYDALIENQINGRPDIIIVNGDRKIAIEIETSKSDFIQNIERDLKIFNEVICVATDKSVEQKIQERLRENSLESKNMKIVLASNFDMT